MPLDRESPVSGGSGAYSPWDLNAQPGDQVDGPGFIDAVSPAFRTENIAGSYLASDAMALEKREYYRVDPDYNPFTNEDLKGYEDHVDRFLEAQNPKVVEAIKADIDREKKDRETIEAAGWAGIGADIAASVLDPTILIPGGAIARGGKAGWAFARSGLSIGAAAAGGAAVQEGLLHATQQTRDVEESAYVVGGSFILGGLLGAAGGQLFNRSDWAKFSRALEEDLADATPHPAEVSQEIVRKLRSAGAASMDEIANIDWEKELSIGGGRAARAVANATAAVRLNPGLELMTSPSMKARSTFLRLAENHVATAGEMEGRTLGPAAESAMKRYHGNLAMFIAKRRENFHNARKAGFKGKMKDFDAAVARATRRGDVDPDGNEFVTAAAKSWRDDVADPLKDEAVDVRLLPEGVKVTTAPSYLYRIYNQERILQGEGKFRAILRRYIRGAVDAAIARQEEIEIAKKINRATDVDEQLTRANDRLASIEGRLDKRGKVRTKKFNDLQNKKLDRFDLLRGRAPREVIQIAKNARDGDSVQDVAARSVRDWVKGSKVKSSDGAPLLVYHGTKSKFSKFQKLSWFAEERDLAEAYASGDSGVQDVIEAYLRIAKPFDTDIGLGEAITFREFVEAAIKQSGRDVSADLRRRLDDIIADAEKISAARNDKYAYWNGELQPHTIKLLEELGFDGMVFREESALWNGMGDPERVLTYAALNPDQIMRSNDNAISTWLSDIGLPPNATAKQVREHLDRALSNEGKLSDLDQKIGRMTGDLEEFDRMTDEITNERLIATAEAGRYADELNELEAKINEVRQFANSSPRVKILVDYADARKAYGKARYDQTKFKNRVEAIERVEAKGNLTPELQDELRAVRADKNKADERAIKAKAKVEKLKPMLPKDQADKLDFSDEMDLDGYVDGIVDDTFNRITGKTVEDVPEWMVPVTQGPLRGRTLHIPDLTEGFEEFLENDMELIARKYVRQMGSEVELTRNFGRADMKDQIKAIRDEYTELRAKTKDAKELDKLNKRERADVMHIEAFRDMLRGNYRAAEERSNWSTFTRLALGWNYIRLLGGVTLSSLPDLANVMTRQGLRSFLDDGLTGLVSNTKAARIARRDAREWGAITETVLQSRLAELAELNDPYAASGFADRLMANATSAFSRVTFLNQWNDMMKTIVTLQAGNKIARLTLGSLDEVPSKWGVVGKQASFAKLKEGERGYLGALGIDENMATRIADQINKHGLQEKGIWGLNLRAWEDKDARRVIAAALNKEADGGVVTPGIADKPLWARSNAGKLAMQFKSFGLAAHQRITISRLQGDKKHLAEFLALGTSLGMFVSYLKYIERGDFESADRLTENPGLWIADGFDRTGLAPVLMDVSNTAEKVGMPFGIRTAAQLIAGDEDRGADVSRYASRNTAGALLGPSIGTLQDMATIASQVLPRDKRNKGDYEVDIDNQGANAIIRQIPGATLPGVRTVVQATVKPALENATK